MISHYHTELIKWIACWPWESFATLTLKYEKISVERAHQMFKLWCRENAKRDHVRVSCLGVLNYDGHPHLHLLILARSFKTGKTMADIDLEDWVQEWPAISELSIIKYPVTPACIYIFAKHMSGCHSMVSYGDNLLKIIKIREPIPSIPKAA